MSLDNKLIMILQEFLHTKDAIEISQRVEELGIDSLRLVELLVALEESFNIEFQESDLDPSKINTVEDLIKLVEKI